MSTVLEVRDVAFAYGKHAVLDGVSFAVQAGEFVALSGANGAGKSTLLRVLLGLLAPSRGSVALLGAAPDRVGERWRVGYVPQRPTINTQLPATALEVVLSGRLARRGWWRRPDEADRLAVTNALKAVDLRDAAEQRFTDLSGGQQQRVLIAKAIANEPDILILDEPIAGVDAASQARFRDTLVASARQGAAVLLVSHELGAVASDLDRVVLLANGRVRFDGTPAALEDKGVSLGVHRHDLPAWLEDQE